MKTEVFVLKEVESGRYCCQNVYVRKEEYHFNIVNAIMYETEEEAIYYRDSLNRACNTEFVRVIPIEILVKE